MKRFLFFSIFIIISFNLFSQHLLDSLFESIKYPEVPEDKSLVYFIRYGVSLNNYGANNLWPTSVSVVLSKDTCLLATLITNNYNYVLMDPGEYEFIVSEGFDKSEAGGVIVFNKEKAKGKVKINLEGGNKYYVTVAKDSYFSYIFVEENEKVEKKLSKLKLSTFPSWIAVFYDIEENVFLKSKEKENEKVYLNNYLENSRYVVGKLVGVSEESYFLNTNGTILKIDNLECKSILFLKDIPSLPSGFDRNHYYKNHILLAATNGEKIIDGLLFRGSEFLEYLFFNQAFFDYKKALYNSDEIFHINTNEDFIMINNLLNYNDN